MARPVSVPGKKRDKEKIASKCLKTAAHTSAQDD